MLRHNSGLRWIGASALSIFVATIPQMAWGQQDGATPGQFEEIIVTAQRRNESLERTPVAVSVLSASALSERGIVSESDLQSSVAGLTVRATQNSNQLNYAIRGQSIDAFSDSRPAVLPYFNEVPVSSEGSTAFFDLQSIQVLKGPQGTLFGRNATGGAVLITSAAPSNQFEGFVSGKLGNYDLRSIEGAINVPLVEDKILLRLSAFHQRRDGYQKDVFDGRDIGKIKRTAARFSLTLRPVEGLSNTTVYNYEDDGGTNTIPVLYGVYPVGFINAPIPANILFTPALDSLFGAGAWATYVAANPRVDPGGLFSYADVQKARGPFKVNTPVDPRHDFKSHILTNTTSLEIAEDTQLRNIFGYVDIHSQDILELDGTPFGIEESGATGRILDSWSVSDELQIVGKAFEKRLDYVAGVFYSKDKNDTLSDATFVGLEPLLPRARQHNDQRRRTESWAVYGHGTYDLSDMTGIGGLKVNAGLRYTHEKIEVSQLPTSVYYNFQLQFPEAQALLSRAFDKMSWQFGIQDQVNSGLLLYAVTRRSFRSGGFNGAAPPFPGDASVGGAAFRPEIATDLELGLKYQGSIGGMPTRFSLAAYNSWVKDVQRTVYVGIPQIGGGLAALTINIPKARIRGVELDGQIAPASWLTIGGSLTYTDAKFTDNESTLFGVTTRYGPFADTPKWAGSAFADIRMPVGADNEAILLHGDVYAQSKFYFSSLNDTINPGTALPGYAIANFRLAWEHVRGSGATISALLRNAFDRTYYTGGLPVGSVLTLNTALPAEPRTFQVEAKFEF
ncbi:TonB-dependent receptor [Sphingobium sp. MI1205]|uniref:TonB-dependent receptor n=1 Tax=Sphingobium sp. MI1205 TaxID=407020 RepID=UPI0009FAD270|nr:TonB-dependent receptor [Sphingobium sp. MI1205]